MRVYASRRMDAMNRLRGFRLRAGMTQAELARAIGTTQSHVSEYESGARRIETMCLSSNKSACRHQLI